MSGNARETALQILISMRTAHAWSDAALASHLSRDGLSAPDRMLATRLVYGVLQNQMLLDFWIGAYCSQKPDHLQPPLLDILRLGVYQIVFLDKIPDSAAVNESVKLAKSCGRGAAAGLVNAVLRKVALNRQNLPTVPNRDPAVFLSVTYSHPKWLVKRLLTLLGPAETESFLRENNAPVPLTVQVNSLKTTQEALTEELEAAGVSAEKHPWVPGCLELSGAGNPTELPSFQTGKILIQDAAARLVTLAARPAPGEQVLDVCAAPGGKSFSAAIAMENRGRILACDLYPKKLSLIREGAARLGITCIETAAADGRETHPEWRESADLVLVDAPCSGLGIIRKKPDIRYKKPDDLLMLPLLQSAILANAATYVRPGGALVYSTCTILPEENEQTTDAFLAEHREFTQDPFELPEPVGRTDGRLTLWPQRNHVDGFYICRMKRI